MKDWRGERSWCAKEVEAFAIPEKHKMEATQQCTGAKESPRDTRHTGRPCLRATEHTLHLKSTGEFYWLIGRKSTRAKKTRARDSGLSDRWIWPGGLSCALCQVPGWTAPLQFSLPLRTRTEYEKITLTGLILGFALLTGEDQTCREKLELITCMT